MLAAAATVPLFFVRLPTAVEGLRRLDRASLLPHRPATAIADQMAPEAGDQFAVALWRAHVERALRAARALKAGVPMPRLAARDPFALRALVLMLVVATFFAAGSERYRRDRGGVRLARRGGVGELPHRCLGDAAALHRPAAADPAGLAARRDRCAPVRPVTVPAGSTLVVRATGEAGLDVAVSGGIAPATGDTRPQVPKGTEERRFTISAAGTATVRGAGDDVIWALQRHPGPRADHRARQGAGGAAARLAAARLQDRGRLRRGGRARRRSSASRAPGADEAKPPHPLFGAPNFTLVLPQARTRNGVGQTTKDLTEHPWAGVDVVMTLVARDEANNEGRSAAARNAAAGAAVHQAACRAR